MHFCLFQYKAKTLNPKWLEQFDLHVFDDHSGHPQQLEMSVWDHDTAGKDDIMGRYVDSTPHRKPLTYLAQLRGTDG